MGVLLRKMHGNVGLVCILNLLQHLNRICGAVNVHQQWDKAVPRRSLHSIAQHCTALQTSNCIKVAPLPEGSMACEAVESVEERRYRSGNPGTKCVSKVRSSEKNTKHI